MKIVAALCLAGLATMPAVHAAPVKKGAQPKASTDRRSPYSTAALDPLVEDLKPNYFGHDCRALAKKLRSLNPEKGEFETTAAYKDRLDSISGKVVVGSIKLGDVVGFVPSTDMLPMFSEQYNADDQSLKLVDYIADGGGMAGGHLAATKKLEASLRSRRTYAASNAYGKGVDVTSSNYDTCALAFSNVDYMRSMSAYQLSTSFTLPPDEARAAKGNITTLYVGNLERPYLKEFSDYLKPTIDTPREAAWVGDALVMKLVQVWFFNKQTGKVYKKLDIP